MNKPGFSFKINPLFLVVLFLFAVLGMANQVLAAFVLVVIHEFVHALVAWLEGYKIFKIELFPFGGMAEYGGLLEMEPWSEIKVALAGPVSNFILAGFFYLLLQTNGQLFTPHILQLLLKYNMIIACFNMLPALPLDGGRVLRGILVSRIGFTKGTHLAIRIAKILAFVGVVLGVWALIVNHSNVWILFISFFVYGAAVKEEGQIIYNLLGYLTQRKRYVDNIVINSINSQVVRGDTNLKEVITYLLPGYYNLFYILDKESKIAGLVSEIQLLDSYFSMQRTDVKLINIIDEND